MWRHVAVDAAIELVLNNENLKKNAHNIVGINKNIFNDYIIIIATYNENEQRRN